MSTADQYGSILEALCLWREARGEATDARRGVLHVIRNRAAQKFFGEDIVSVILRPYQFSSFLPHDPNASKMPNPRDSYEWQAWLDCCALVDNPGDDPTGGALLYESIADATKRPAWAVPAKQLASIGNFRFYRK